MYPEQLQVSPVTAAIAEMAKKHMAHVEALTVRQFEDALTQALACGDFMRLVQPNGAQTVIYLPFATEQDLRSRIHELEKRLAEIQTP